MESGSNEPWAMRNDNLVCEINKGRSSPAKIKENGTEVTKKCTLKLRENHLFTKFLHYII